jgi:hypothetical protein
MPKQAQRSAGMFETGRVQTRQGMPALRLGMAPAHRRESAPLKNSATILKESA